jgi:uncharacterized protein YutD
MLTKQTLNLLHAKQAQRNYTQHIDYIQDYFSKYTFYCNLFLMKELHIEGHPVPVIDKFSHLH